MNTFNKFRISKLLIVFLSFAFIFTASAVFANLNFGSDSISSTGGMYFPDHIAIGSNASIDGPNIWGDPQSQVLSINEEITTLSSLNEYEMAGGTIILNVDLPVESEDYAFEALSTSVTTDASNNQVVGLIQGQSILVDRKGSGNGVNSGGVAVYEYNTGDGDLSDGLYGYYADIQNKGAGDVENVFSFITSTYNRGSGDITNNYGFYAGGLNNQGAGTVTNNYGLYVVDEFGAINNYAIKTGLGKVELGDTLTTKNGGNVASATTTTLPGGNMFHITGTTNITTLNTCNAANNGRVVILIFDGILTFTDGNNLKLAGNFTTTADDSITLGCDGSNWYETFRSTN